MCIRDRVDAGPFVDAVGVVAAGRGVSPEALCGSPKQRAVWARVLKGVERRGEAYRVPVNTVLPLLKAVGVDPEWLWGERVWEAAYAAREERVDQRVGAWDVRFDMPKSFSLAITSADGPVRQRLFEVWAETCRATLDELAGRVAFSVTGHQGLSLIHISEPTRPY